MKRTRLFFITAMLTAASAAMAQTTIKGVVVSETTAEGEPFATVRVFKQGKTDNPVDIFLTDEEGRFSHKVQAKGMHDITVSSIGKLDLKKTVQLGDDKVLDLDTLYCKDDAKMLSAVEVVAMKPLVKMEVDKMSYNVAEDRDAKASTVLDMLRKVPMVTVDGQDNITVNGSSSFQIYVDGKPNPMFASNPSMIFKSMPATAVKSIEVLTNPGAKFDAEGASGVLNIVLNRQDPQAMQSLNGYNGTLRASAGNRSVGGGAFVSGQQGRFSYSANAMVNYSRPGTTTVESEQQNGEGTILGTASTSVKLPFTMGNVSLGYDLDSMSSVNATATITSFHSRNDMANTSVMRGGNYGSGYQYGTDMNMKFGRTSFSGNLDYQRFFNRQRTQSLVLTYQLAYSPSENKTRSIFDNGSTDFIDLTDRYSLNKERTTDHTFQIDYTHPVREGHTLSMGGKLMTRRATSDAKYYLQDVYDERSSMDYLYTNTILAGYAEYAANWNKLGAKAGLRYEHTWQDVEYRLGNGTDFKKDYGSLVPTANLSYNLSQGSNIGLTYNMRISRPGISYLNPYVDHSNPTALSYGNTDLDVEKSHNLSLVYNLFGPKLMLNLNLHHNFTDNAIDQYSFYDTATGLLNTTYGNIVKRHLSGANFYANWLAAKNTRLFMNGSLNYNHMSSSTLALSNHGWQGNLMMGLQQTLPWDLKMGAYLITSSKSYTLQGWSSGFNMLSANVSKTLLGDRLTLSLQGMVGLSDGGNLKMESYTSGKDFTAHQTIKVPMSGFTFTVSYAFGNTKRQARQHVSKVTNDYIEQQTQGEMINNLGNGQQ